MINILQEKSGTICAKTNVSDYAGYWGITAGIFNMMLRWVRFTSHVWNTPLWFSLNRLSAFFFFLLSDSICSQMQEEGRGDIIGQTIQHEEPIDDGSLSHLITYLLLIHILWSRWSVCQPRGWVKRRLAQQGAQDCSSWEKCIDGTCGCQAWRIATATQAPPLIGKCHELKMSSSSACKLGSVPRRRISFFSRKQKNDLVTKKKMPNRICMLCVCVCVWLVSGRVAAKEKGSGFGFRVGRQGGRLASVSVGLAIAGGMIHWICDLVDGSR